VVEIREMFGKYLIRIKMSEKPCMEKKSCFFEIGNGINGLARNVKETQKKCQITEKAGENRGICKWELWQPCDEILKFIHS